jgi:hypothetical protein
MPNLMPEPQAPSALSDAQSNQAAPASRPEVTAALARGVSLVLQSHGFATIWEAPLGNGRRADVMGVSRKGEIWIVETKSGLADFAADAKWPEYQPYCDAFLFGVAEDFPRGLIPVDVGLIVADRFGGEILRHGPQAPLSAPRRKAVLLGFARLAALRLSRHEAVTTTPRDSAYEEPI